MSYRELVSSARKAIQELRLPVSMAQPDEMIELPATEAGGMVDLIEALSDATEALMINGKGELASSGEWIPLDFFRLKIAHLEMQIDMLSSEAAFHQMVATNHE